MATNLTASNVLKAFAATNDEYLTRFGEVTRENFEAWVNGVLTIPTVRNSFCDYLINKIGRTYVNAMYAHNPLEFLRGEDLPFGSTIEDMFVEIARGSEFDPTGKGVDDRYLPDVKVLYYYKNFDFQYSVSVSDKELKLAFYREGQMQALIERIVNSLYQGARHDSFILLKQLMSEYNGWYAVKVPALDGTEANAKAVGQAISLHVMGSAFDNRAYNAAGVVNNIPDGEGILIMTVAANVALNFDYLANVFNLDKVELRKRTVIVDSIGDDSGAIAVWCDRRLFQNHYLYEGVETRRNEKGRFTNYFLNEEAIFAMGKWFTGIKFTTGATVTITYSDNQANASTWTRTVESGQPFSLPFNTFKVQGKKFAGWSLDAEGTTLLAELSEQTAAADTTIYAIFK